MKKSKEITTSNRRDQIPNEMSNRNGVFLLCQWYDQVKWWLYHYYHHLPPLIPSPPYHTFLFLRSFHHHHIIQHVCATCMISLWLVTTTTTDVQQCGCVVVFVIVVKSPRRHATMKWNPITAIVMVTIFNMKDGWCSCVLVLLFICNNHHLQLHPLLPLVWNQDLELCHHHPCPHQHPMPMQPSLGLGRRFRHLLHPLHWFHSKWW